MSARPPGGIASDAAAPPAPPLKAPPAAVDTTCVASVAHEIPRSRERSALRPHLVARAGPVSGVVALSFAVRTLLALLRPTPAYYPDEYLYAELGRSLATTGHATVRGGAAHFPALLQPLLTAPAWLAGDVTTSYRLIQIGGALAMSLAAVPIYLLAC